MSWTSSGASPNTGATPSYTGSGASSNSGATPTLLPSGFGAAEYFKDGKLYQIIGSDVITYDIADSDEISNGQITVTLEEDPDPWPDGSHGWILETDGGLRFGADDLDAGEAGSPYTIKFGNFGLQPDANTAPTPSWTGSGASANTGHTPSYTGSGASSNTGHTPSYTGSGASSNTGVQWSNPLPDGFGEADYFNGGVLHHLHADGSSESYDIEDSSAMSSGGVIQLTLDDAATPWASFETTDRWSIETSDGELYECDLATTDGEFSNFRAPADAIGAAPSYTGSEASANTGAAPSYTGSGASANDGAAPDWDSDPAEQMVLGTEGSPVEGTVAPDALVAVDHTAPLDNSQSYTVWVRSRMAPVTITLPNPAANNQVIQIGDTSGQAAIYPVTVDPNGLTIDGSSDPRVYSINHFFISLRFDAEDGWKLQ